MLLVAVAAIALVTVPLFRGRLKLLGGLRFRAVWILVVAFAMQLALAVALKGPPTQWRAAIHIGSYALAAVFLLLNRRAPGIWLIGLGGGLNLLVIAANGGVMPAAAHALATAGVPAAGALFSNSVAIAHPRLAFLGDVFAVPSSIPLANVFSVGDVCVGVGTFVMLHRATGSLLVPSGDGQFAQLTRRPSFVRLCGAQVISNLGDWAYVFFVQVSLTERYGPAKAVPLLALLLVSQLIPSAIVGTFFAGPLADRRSRKGLMVGADLARLAVVAALLLAQTPSILQLCIVAAFLGGLGAIFQPSLFSSIPNVVGEGEVVAANATVSATFHFAILAGPAVGGLLVGRISPQAFFAFNALSFGLSALLVGSTKLPVTSRPGGPTKSSAFDDLREGIRYVVRTRLPRGVLIVMGLVLFGAATKAPIEYPFVREVLAQGKTVSRAATIFGLITGAWGMGMLLGSIAAPALARRWAREKLLPIAILIVGLAVVAVSRTHDFATVLLAWLLAGSANAVGTVSYESLLQERTPDALRGRVFAATEATLDVAYLLGAAAAAFLGRVMDVPSVLALSGLLLVVGALASRMLLPAPAIAEKAPAGSASGGREAVGETAPVP
ncbi:MAG: MFS transporter [Actinobacteria bacterium]|nr:MFS transporter [Actinomycetota bacterium]